MLYKTLRHYKDNVFEYQKFFPQINKLIGLAKKVTLFFQKENPRVKVLIQKELKK
jgi:hypothetical protein